MNKWLTYLIGPESVLVVIAIFMFSVAARHNSGEGEDIRLVEKLVMTLAFWVVPMAFATIAVPGARNWLWLARAVVFTSIILLVIATRLIAAFGTGAKGQDAAFIMVLIFGVSVMSICSAMTGALILAETRPAFAGWFRERWIIGITATALAALPIAVTLGIVQLIGVATVASVWSAIKR